MTAQQAIILSCLEINLAAAKTKAMRKFCTDQIESFQKSITRANRKEPDAPRAFSSFLSHLEHSLPKD